MRLTNNSLSTTIAWVSSCLLAGGVSTLFNENTRMLWMLWGCFGLASAVGLDFAARVRERMRMDELNRVATRRFERDMKVESEEKETNAAIREVVVRMLTSLPPSRQSGAAPRAEVRHPCELGVEILLHQDVEQVASKQGNSRRSAKITNLSALGFELTLTEPLQPQRITIMIPPVDGTPVTMYGEVLWCGPQPDGFYLAGGRFLNVVSADKTEVRFPTEQTHVGQEAHPSLY